MARAEAKGTCDIHRKVLQQRWGRILAILGKGTHPVELTEEVLGKYAQVRKREVKGQTVARELADIKRVLLVAKKKKLIAELPETWPKLPKDAKDKRQAGKLHSLDVCRAVLAEVPDDVREAAWFCYATGLRFGELRRVSVDWLEQPPFKTEVPWLLRVPAWAAKGRKARTVGIVQDIADMLFRRAEVLKSPLIFPRANYRKALHSACKRVGYAQTITLRDLRHMFGSEALKRSGNLQAVSDALGHSVLTTTTLYLHSEEQDVAALALLVRAPVPSTVPAIPGIPAGHTPAPVVQPSLQVPDFVKQMVEPIGIEPTTSGLQRRVRPDIAELSVSSTVEKSEQSSRATKQEGHTDRAYRADGHTSAVSLDGMAEGAIIDLEPVPLAEIMRGLPWAAQAPARRDVLAPLRPIVAVACESCGRSADVEDGPGIWECIFCGSGKVRVGL